MGQKDPHGVIIPGSVPHSEQGVELMPKPQPFPESSADIKMIMDLMAGDADQCSMTINGTAYRFGTEEQPSVPPPTKTCEVRIVWEWGEKLKVLIDTSAIKASSFSPGYMTLLLSSDDISYVLSAQCANERQENRITAPASVTTKVVLLRYEKALAPETLVVLRSILRDC